MTIDDLLKCSEEYTRAQFESASKRLAWEIAFKHDIGIHEVDDLIREHRYIHTADCPEDEYLELMSFAKAVGWR